MKRIVSVFLAFSLILIPGYPVAKEIQGRNFAETLQFENTKLELKGLGLKSYFMIKVLVVGFYLGYGIKLSDALNDVPRRIEVSYFYYIPGDKLAVETKRRIQLNTTPEEYAQIKDRVKVMDSYFVDLKPGDRYALTYIPGKGTFFTYNGRVVGTIEGADFAQALFAVWVGEHPISETLKDQLLNYVR